MSELKICKDCIFCDQRGFVLKCLRPKKERIDITDGTVEPVFCSVERMFSGIVVWFDGSCGKQGRFFRRRSVSR